MKSRAVLFAMSLLVSVPFSKLVIGGDRELTPLVFALCAGWVIHAVQILFEERS